MTLTEALIAFGFGALLYPFAVLMVAMTGPHSATEQLELVERRAADRRKRMIP